MTARAAELRLRSFIKLTRIALPFADTTAVVVSLFFFGLEREKKGTGAGPGNFMRLVTVGTPGRRNGPGNLARARKTYFMCRR